VRDTLFNSGINHNPVELEGTWTVIKGEKPDVLRTLFGEKLWKSWENQPSSRSSKMMGEAKVRLNASLRLQVTMAMFQAMPMRHASQKFTAASRMIVAP
jgi:hypothetical protein